MIKTSVKTRKSIVEALNSIVNDKSNKDELLKALSYHNEESDWNWCYWMRDFEAKSIKSFKTDDGISIKIKGNLSHVWVDNDSDAEDYGLTRNIDYDDEDDKELFDDEYKGDDNDDDVEYDDEEWRKKNCFDSECADEDIIREIDNFAGSVLSTLGKAASLDVNLYSLTKVIYDDLSYDDDYDIEDASNYGEYDKKHFTAHASSKGVINLEIKIK